MAVDRNDERLHGEHVEERRGRSRTGLWIVAGLGALLVLGLALTPVFWMLGDRSRASAGPELGVTINSLYEDPEDFAGKIVVVSGAVDEVLHPNLFILGEDVPGTFVGDVRNVLVVNATGELIPEMNLDVTFQTPPVLQVRGEVYPFNRGLIEREFGTDLADIGIEEDDLEVYRDTPVLIAEEIAVLPGPQPQE